MARERGPFEPPAGYPADRRWPYVSAVVKAAMAGVITEDQAVDKVLGFWSTSRPRPDWSSVAGLVGRDEARRVAEWARLARESGNEHLIPPEFTEAEHRDGIWKMTDTELNADLAKAWDAGWRQRSLEEEHQRADPTHLIFRANPYRAAG